MEQTSDYQMIYLKNNSISYSSISFRKNQRDNNPNKEIQEPYVLVYELHNNRSLDIYAQELAKHTGMELLRVSPFAHHCGRGGKFELCPDLRRFVKLVADAECVVTDSFHGTCIAVTFHKKFVDILPGATSTRNQSLLETLGLTDRIVTDFKDYDLPMKPICYNNVIETLQEERNNSFEILRTMIN